MSPRKEDAAPPGPLQPAYAVDWPIRIATQIGSSHTMMHGRKSCERTGVGRITDWPEESGSERSKDMSKDSVGLVFFCRRRASTCWALKNRGALMGISTSAIGPTDILVRIRMAYV
jgi:hypothetical protein